MKKKLLSSLVAFFALSIVACSSATNNNEESTSARHEHTFNVEVWEKNETQHWHPATCEHTTIKGDAAAHTFEEVVAERVEATCSAPGKKVEVCSVCNYRKETVLTADHDMQAYAFTHEEGENEVTTTMKKCSRDNYYELSFSAVDPDVQLAVSGDKKSGGWVKLSTQVAEDGSGSASWALYKFYSPIAMSGRFWIDITGNTSSHWTRASQSGSQSLYYTYNDTTTHINTWKNKVEFGTDPEDLGEVDFTNAKYTVEGQEIAFAELEFEDFGTLASSSSQSGAGTTISVPMPEMNISEGINYLKFTRLTGYAFNMHNFTFKSNILAA